jgi:outer membrane protein assembly factor BamE (lipoprotein component of BamABCDE complex)
MSNSTRGLTRIAIAGLALIALTACATRVATRGNLPDPEKLSEIHPGQVSRDEVEEILGTPSSIALFDKETWYYISERTETTAIFKPDVLERQVVIIRFNSDGTVSDVETRGLESAREIDPVKRTTPTAGQEMTVIQQLFGNVGRFNRPEGEGKPK